MLDLKSEIMKKINWKKVAEVVAYIAALLGSFAGGSAMS
jgi:hypothetical protein